MSAQRNLNTNNDTEQLLQVSQLCVSYSSEHCFVDAVSKLKFALDPGETLGLVG
jgi:ABC-type glutathione transport system ATPase component